ncbi:hypothetical protein HMN09_00412200 [Mycena chlorophos]|uniref:Uncharacterized protein n=1 Tax=Mycena chlorophos TaxID=658473 RepID=A0A8H6TGA5_MYCCL|nr:hypothetical protein HMN09_00412200 [Mycena chlorophos]
MVMKSASDTRRPYSGATRSLVCAIDVGTTFSGVSYSILEPGEVPKIFGVTRFPGQEYVAGNSKIPSMLYYDSNGRMIAAGAEAEGLAAQAEEESWTKVDLFKLRLRPRSMNLNMNGMRLGRLPLGKTPVHVLGDFLAYLFACTRNFITETHANGTALWAAVESDIKFVLSHPNGWEGAQQSKFRRAAIHGGLVPNTNEGKARIFFVTEGEASLHACVLNGLAQEVLSDTSKPGFLIADAGGGTWDLSAYSITGNHPLQIEELAPPDCIFAGSVFVSRRARRFLEEKLRHSKYGSPESVEHITRRFDETTKRLFRDDHSLQFVSFGSPLDKDSAVGIRGGKLKLTGEEVRDLFEPSIEAAFEAIKAQVDASSGVIKSVWLVGGFAANHWLFTQLQERLAPYGVTVNRPDSQTSKAVCDGAIGFYLDHHVSVRMSKAFYGVEYLRTFDPEDEEHVVRESTLVELPSGPRLLPDAFDCILKQGIKVKESTVFSRKYSTELTSLNVLSVFEVLVWCYRGKGEVPMWIYRHEEEFSTLCTVRADLSPLKSTAVPQEGKNGTFWKVVFSIEIHFGLTEFRARLKYLDNGEVKYGAASIIYNERGRRVEEDEPDMFSEDDMTVASTRSERVRSPPPLSRPPSSIAVRAPIPPREPTPRASTPAATEPDSVPEVTRLADEKQPSKVGSRSASGSERESASGEREPSRGRRSGKSKGKERERERLEESLMSRSSSKLGDELMSVWGKDAPMPSPRAQSRGFEAPETVLEEPPQLPAEQQQQQQHEQPPLSATPKASSPSLPPVAEIEPSPPSVPPKSPSVAEKALEDVQVEEAVEQAPVSVAEAQPDAQEPSAPLPAEESGAPQEETPAPPVPDQDTVEGVAAETVEPTVLETIPETTLETAPETMVEQPEAQSDDAAPAETTQTELQQETSDTTIPAEPPAETAAETVVAPVEESVPVDQGENEPSASADVVADAPQPSPAKSAPQELPVEQGSEEESGAKEDKITTRQTTPLASPRAMSPPLADILTSLGIAKLTPGLQHLALPEQIPLPQSSAGSPTWTTPRMQTPLAPFDSNLNWMSEGDIGVSRAASVVPSPIKTTLSLGGEETGGTTTATKSKKGKSNGSTPRRSRKTSAAQKD